jgi:DNA-directed RNA polymerase subunit RPC12/RpoP
MYAPDNTQIKVLNTVYRCPACKKFSHTDGSVEATCEHCGSYLQPIALKEKLQAEEAERQRKLKHEHPVFWVNVKPGDSSLRKSFVRLMQGGQLMYAAIVSFLLWVVAIVAG